MGHTKRCPERPTVIGEWSFSAQQGTICESVIKHLQAFMLAVARQPPVSLREINLIIFFKNQLEV